MTILTEPKKRSNVSAELMDWLDSIIFSVIFVVLLFTFVFRIVGVEGHSMDPTLQDGSRVLLSKLFYQPKYKDIVVVTQPNSVHKPIIKRIIATSGQTIEVDYKNGVVKVDGTPLSESYTMEPTFTRGDMTGPVTVPEGFVFVMGDNRNDSLDSRFNGVGMIDERYILGKVYFRVWPFGKGMKLF